MSSYPATGPVRIALIGAGVFARDAHLPSLLRHPDEYQLVALFSRTLANAQALAQQVPYPVNCTDDLAELLARPDVEAVIVLLPIPVAPPVIAQALAAGKHVLSEKPIAPTVVLGRQLLAQQTHQPELFWMVGENWRYEAAFLHAAELVRSGEIGDPLTCHWAHFAPFTARSKYYHTTWRRNRSFPGGIVLDTGVHHMAVLRLILGEVAAVSAVTRQLSPDLPPLDTVAATLHFESGAVGAYLATYALGAPWPPQLHVAGTQGALRVQRGEVELTRGGNTERIECSGFDGVEKELVAFARAIRHGEPFLTTPVQALQDLAVVEAMLEAAATGQRIEPERFV
jgi:predicted dehydrogenase